MGRQVAVALPADDDAHEADDDAEAVAFPVAFPDEVGEDEVGDGLYYQTGAA